MFRSLKKYTSGLEDGYDDFNESQRTLYQSQLPNIFPVASESVKKSLNNVVGALATVDPVTWTTSTEGVDIYKYATSMELPEELRAKTRACETASIDQLIANQNPYDKVRCGWVYEKGVSGTAPKQSRGVLGTKEGPMNFTGVQTSAANYYWNPLEAQKVIARDRCAELVSCANVENSDFAGKCAYDPIRGRGVPIFPDGQLMFPNDSNLSANPANLIMKRGSCPAPPPAGSVAAEYQQSRDVCKPLSNGTLSRDCILQQVQAAGCNNEGALALALSKGATLNDYTMGLRNTRAYTIYQQRSNAPLSEAAIKDGSVGRDIALNNFRVLSQESAKATVNGLQAAARDLCVKAGTLDKYDFCSELTETSRPPYDLKCLQGEWQKRGGSSAGLKYPSSSTIDVYWNKIPTWGLALQTMTRMSVESRDLVQENYEDYTAEQKQRTALNDFYGIRRESPAPKQIPSMAGVEVFWIDLTNNTFLGRVISEKAPVIDTGGVIPIVNKADSVQMIMITNMRPVVDGLFRIGMTTDDGTSVRINKNYQPSGGISVYRPDLTKRTSDEMTEYYLQGSTTHINDACWNFKKGGPNIIVADWYENGGWARFQLFLTPCDNPANKLPIPDNRYTLTQEGDAPFLSFEYTENGLRERRLSALFESPHSGGANVDTTKKAIRLMRNGSIIMKRPLLTNSWRSITVHWTPYVKFADRQVFMSFGSLFEIYFEGDKTYVKFSGPSLTKTISWQTTYSPGLDFIFYINMRSSFEGSVPDIITFGSQQREWYAGGNWRGGVEMRMPNNQPVYNMTDSNELRFGTMNGVSADVGIKAVRMFDYELDASDLARDASNKWVRQWIGERIE